MKFRIFFWDLLPYKIIVDRRFRSTCCLHHRPDDGGSTYLWNVGRQLFYTAVHPRRQFWTLRKWVAKQGYGRSASGSSHLQVVVLALLNFRVILSKLHSLSSYLSGRLPIVDPTFSWDLILFSKGHCNCHPENIRFSFPCIFNGFLSALSGVTDHIKVRKYLHKWRL
jgi:hypothetical protein